VVALEDSVVALEDSVVALEDSVVALEDSVVLVVLLLVVLLVVGLGPPVEALKLVGGWVGGWGRVVVRDRPMENLILAVRLLLAAAAVE